MLAAIGPEPRLQVIRLPLAEPRPGETAQFPGLSGGIDVLF
jgi:hypothetical protein